MKTKKSSFETGIEKSPDLCSAESAPSVEHSSEADRLRLFWKDLGVKERMGMRRNRRGIKWGMEHKTNQRGAHHCTGVDHWIVRVTGFIQHKRVETDSTRLVAHVLCHLMNMKKNENELKVKKIEKWKNEMEIAYVFVSITVSCNAICDRLAARLNWKFNWFLIWLIWEKKMKKKNEKKEKRIETVGITKREMLRIHSAHGESKLLGTHIL